MRIISKLNISHQVPRWPRRPMASWLVSESVWSKKYYPPVISTGKVATQIMYSVLGPSLQESHGDGRAWPVKGNKANEGLRGALGAVKLRWDIRKNVTKRVVKHWKRLPKWLNHQDRKSVV